MEIVIWPVLPHLIEFDCVQHSPEDEGRIIYQLGGGYTPRYLGEVVSRVILQTWFLTCYSVISLHMYQRPQSQSSDSFDFSQVTMQNGTGPGLTDSWDLTAYAM